MLQPIANLPDHTDSAQTLFRSGLKDRIRAAFGIPFANSLIGSDFNVRNGGYYPDSDYAEKYEYGLTIYVEALNNANRVALFSDIPCVVIHPRKQENEYWHELILCFRVGGRSFFVKEVAFPRDSESRNQQIMKRDLAQYEPELTSLIIKARAEADMAQAKSGRFPQDPIVSASVIDENGRTLWQRSGEETTMISAGTAFAEVLRRQGIVVRVSTRLD